MARRKKKAREGTPEWMVTYGDMMTLLLCFFVMIVAMSELKRDERFQKVVDSVQKEFGYNASLGTAPARNPPEFSPIRRKLAPAAEQKDLDKGFARDDSPIGEYPTVERIREGQRYTVGGVVAFAEGRAELLPAAQGPLMQIAEQIRGWEHKIELHGHCSAVPLGSRSPFDSHMELSLARAMAVSEWLVGTSGDRGRIDPRRIRVGGAGKYEPLVLRAYEKPEMVRNDRVDVIMIEALAPQFEGGLSESTRLSRRGDDLMGETDAARE